VSRLLPITLHLGDRSPTNLPTVSCYSTPEIIPIFISDRAFRFQFRHAPAVPALLHATSGARAIGLRHFTLVRFEEPVRNPPRRAPHGYVQTGQIQIAPAHHAQFLHSHGQYNHLALNGNQLLQVAGPGWVNALPAIPQPTLLAPAPQVQGPNSLALVPYNPQAVAQAQRNSQSQLALQPGIQNNALQPYTAGGSSQQTTGQQNSSQQASQHQNMSVQSSPGGSFQAIPIGQPSFPQNVNQYQSIFGGSTQSTAPAGQSFTQTAPQYQSPYGGNLQSISMGPQNATQNGSQHQSIFGGSFQSTPVGQQVTVQNGPHSNSTNQTIQFFNPSSALTAFTSTAGSSIAVVLQHFRTQRRLLIADEDSEDDTVRYFYVNPGSDLFKLQVGEPTGYCYPTFTIAQYPHILTSVSVEDRQSYLQDLQQAYTAPAPFPDSFRLPDFFAKIQHLVINLELAPCLAPMRSDGFRNWLHTETATFCETTIKSTIAKFPKVKNLDLVIEGDFRRRTWAKDEMVLRHFRQAPIREENGVEFGQAELGLLEMEIRVWIMSEYMGKHGPEGPEVRIVVHVPRQYSQTKW
jgi:hypothetical protein